MPEYVEIPAIEAIINKLQDKEDKDFIKEHIMNLNELINVLEKEIQHIKEYNTVDSQYVTAKQFLTRQFNRLSEITDKIRTMLENTICKECGHVSYFNVKQLAEYIATLSEMNDDELFSVVMSKVDYTKDTKIIKYKQLEEKNDNMGP